MVPTPQAKSTSPTAKPPGAGSETVVISGISVSVSEALHSKDFSDILYNKVDPVANGKVRWDYSHPEVPKHHGKMPKLECFDAQFFKVSNHLARCMDPMGRKVLEHTYRAIYDAGLSADYFAGRNVGVYIGSSVAESEKVSIYDPYVSSHSMPGCSKSMFANRISYWLDVKGPSMSFDNACCSSLVALEQAYLAIRRGDCEAAIVGGSYVALHPQTVLQYGRIIPLCGDGKVKSFDDHADGSAMSDGISVVLLQKAENAMRLLSNIGICIMEDGFVKADSTNLPMINTLMVAKFFASNPDFCSAELRNVKTAIIYAELVHIRSEYDPFNVGQGAHELGFKRDSAHLTKFLQGFYAETDVSPKEVKYVEGFGSGISEVDRTELETIEQVFCKERKTSDSLLVGSVTSNIGFTEAASALCRIAKILLGYQKGLLAGNLHCTSPRRDLAALRDGRMRILTEHEPFHHSYAAINDFSITGINGHILLRGFDKHKVSTPKSTIPYLVNVSGRKESSVQMIIDDLKARPVDHQELALLHNIHEEKNSGHLARGFVVLDTNEVNETVCLSESVAYYDDVKRPLWFVYSGMGSQWAGMGAQLMRIPTFAAAIQRCHKVLAPKGLDIIHILTTPDKTIYDNILHSFVGIAAVQIGLTDVLRELGLVPDGIIGHSVGELGCAYADDCFTAEEMILAAYYRGLVSVQTKFIFGSMAAVGIGYQEAVKLCPSEIEVACHNGPESCTISGPADVMREFVASLTKQGIFAKEVPCSNIAYHSRYIAQAGPKLLEHLSQVIQNPKRRSERWVSSSVPQERWSEENAQYSSAWYHTNNLLSPVLFEETSRLVPAGAVTVEVAPHGLLQAILKPSLHPDCRHIPLTKRGHADSALFFLQAVGKLFTQGYNPKVKSLYPKVEFPVSIETPSLSHLVEWNDSDKWTLLLCKPIVKEPTRICKFLVSIHDEENKYLRGNVIRGKTLYPYSAVLVAVWDTLAMSSGVQRKAMSVQFSDVHLYTQPILHEKRHLQFKVEIHEGTGEFEVTDEHSKIVSGNICETEGDLIQEPEKSNDINTEMEFDSSGIYDLLQDRDYSYTGEFRSIFKCNNAFTEAQLIWKDNWATLIDGMIQINALQSGHSNVTQPRHIHKLTISPKDHGDKMQQIDGKTLISSSMSPVYDCTRCGGVLMEKLRFEYMSPVHASSLKLATVHPQNKSVNIINDVGGEEFYVTWNEESLVKRDTILKGERVGDLKSLHWVVTPQEVKSSTDFLVQVQYAGLNVLDSNVATGVIPPKEGTLEKHGFGMDYSGITDEGSRVMGLVRGGAAGSRVRAVPALTWPVPAHWTLEDAATVPLAYAQAFYCLGIKAPLLPGMTILVQGGSGALGQAAISIALAHKCKVFTTVKDARKKKFLLRMFPDLTEDMVGCSRDHSFADLILLATEGRGCDIIICCATGHLKNATLKCGAFSGIIIDTVQAHIKESYNYGMFYLTNQRSYVIVDFYNIFRNEETMTKIQLMMSEGIARGYVRPLSRVTFAAQECSRAFRLLAASQHRGRVLLRLRRDSIRAMPRLTCSSELHQLVVCNENNFSLQLVDRLVNCGARKLILYSCPSSALFRYKMESWRKLGVEIQILSSDKMTVIDFKRVLSNNNIEGIFVVSSGKEQDEVVTNLDVASRELCPALKYFTILSTAHNFSTGEQLCVAREKQRLPASIVYLPPNNKKETTDLSFVSQANIMDVVERAILSNQLIMKVHLQPNTETSLLDQIANLADINIPSHINGNTTLKDLGLNNSYSPIICSFLRNSYNIATEIELIPTLTVSLLKQYEKNIKEPDFKEMDGLAAFYSYVDRDELLGVSNMVTLPTLVKSATVSDEMIDLDQQYLWIVPGLEGNYERFRTFSERLKIPALVLQPGLDYPQETIEETARKYIEVVTTKTGISKHKVFYILGYETGIFVAFEMAAIMERNGFTGTVFCVGGDPRHISQILNDKLKDFNTDDALQNAIITHMVTLLCGGVNYMNMKNQQTMTWQKKVDKAVEHISRNSSYSIQYARAVIEAAYIRTKNSICQKIPHHLLKSEVILLHSTYTKDTTKDSEGLWSEKPLKTYKLDVPLEFSIQHPQSTSIVNSHLGFDVIENYENQNHCEGVIDPDMFVSKFVPAQEDED